MKLQNMVADYIFNDEMKDKIVKELNENINNEIRKRFTEGYDLNKLCLHWYNIFKNVDSIDTDE